MEMSNSSTGEKKVLSFKTQKRIYTDSSSESLDLFHDDEDIANYAYHT